ncbi:MAG: DUF6785 family protein [Candidatus Latescibacterota bacterium]|nr:DUF6785 family protein [Candidatus Latescibacterota bacterium]
MKTGIPSDFRAYLSGRGASLTGEQGADHQHVRARAIGVGAFLSIFLAVGSNYTDIVLRGTYLTLDFSAPGAVFVFVVLVLGLNTLYRWTARRVWVSTLVFVAITAAFVDHCLQTPNLSPMAPGMLFVAFLCVSMMANTIMATRGGSLGLNNSELIVVYIMLLVVASLATMGLCETILPAISGLFYYATPENKWLEQLLPIMPQPLLVDDGAENALFFEGIGPLAIEAPYSIWIRPLLLWSVFLLGLYVSMISIAVILRRQWVERERLAYPLVQAAQLMISGEDENRLLNGFFRNKTMWAGASVSITVGLLRMINFHVGGFPVFILAWTLPLGYGQGLTMKVLFDIIGFSYLIGPEIAAGVWVFSLLAKAERMAFSAYAVSQEQVVFGIVGSELLHYQGLGALLVFVGIGLWVGREHLHKVWHAFLGREGAAIDDDEIMSYRGAVAGTLGGILVMLVWFAWLGVPIWAGLVFIILALAIFIGITRIVAEAGMPTVITPMTAPDFMVFGLGSNLLGPSATATMATTYVWAADIRVFLLGMVANGLKLIEGMDKRSRRLVFWSILLAIFLGITASLWTVMDFAYKGGGVNTSLWFFRNMPIRIYQTAAIGLESNGVYWLGMQFMGLGAAGMLLLMWMRQRFLWWPLHPIGFPIMTNWLMEQVWFSVFLAWLIKVTILRYGGATLFVRSRYFFLGLLVGQALTAGLSLTIDYVTGSVGNYVFGV